MSDKKKEVSKFVDLIKNNIRAIVLIVFLIWVAWLWVAFRFIDDSGQVGIFGDAFGTINALFSGLAFLGIIYAIVLQREDIKKQTEMLELQKEELKLQREELTLTRNVLSEQKDQMEKQAQALQKQNFESTFFNFIRLHAEILKSLKCSGRKTGNEYYGVECLDVTFNNFEESYFQFKSEQDDSGLEIEVLREFCDEYFEGGVEFFWRYFQSAFVMLQFVDSYYGENRDMYIDIVRAQLSTVELIFLHYYCLTIRGRDSIKPLLKKYNILAELTVDDLMDPDHLTYL